MPTFGFSAYLKLICLNPKPQRREVRERLLPSDGNGYDFHRSLRLLSRKYILEGEDVSELNDAVQKIVREPERNSARSGLERLISWRSQNSGDVVDFDSVVFHSQNGLFGVKFTPDFGVNLDGKKTAIHIWNTKRPELDRRFLYGALALFPSMYARTANQPDDLAVLSLRNQRIYRLSDVRDATAFGLSVAMAIENLFQSVAREDGLPIRPSKPGPSAPSPTPL